MECGGVPHGVVWGLLCEGPCGWRHPTPSPNLTTPPLSSSTSQPRPPPHEEKGSRGPILPPTPIPPSLAGEMQTRASFGGSKSAPWPEVDMRVGGDRLKVAPSRERGVTREWWRSEEGREGRVSLKPSPSLLRGPGSKQRRVLRGGLRLWGFPQLNPCFLVALHCQGGCGALLLRWETRGRLSELVQSEATVGEFRASSG